MGMYKHPRRSSIDLLMQVEQESRNRNKTTLRSHFKDLRFDSSDPNANPVPLSRSRAPSLQHKSKPDSQLHKLPAKVILPAHLSQRNRRQIKKVRDREGKHTWLPPIETRTDSSSLQASADHGRATLGQAEDEEVGDRNTVHPRVTPVLKTSVNSWKERRSNKSLDKAGATQISALYKSENQVLRLPTINSASPKHLQRDPGHNQLQYTGLSLPMKRSNVGEESKIFSHPLIILPAITDPVHTEIKLTTQPAKPDSPVAEVEAFKPNIKPATIHNSRSNFYDHFPQGDKLLSEFDNSSTKEDEEQYKETKEEEEDEEGEGNQLPPLFIDKQSESKMSLHNFMYMERNLPWVRLDIAMNPIIFTTVSENPGVAAAIYMSMETLERKGDYISCVNPDHKRLVLIEMLHLVRQRMQSNKEALLLSGVQMMPCSDSWGVDNGQSERTLVLVQERKANSLIKLPKAKRMKRQYLNNSTSKLKSYLHKLSSTRKANSFDQQQKEKTRSQSGGLDITEIVQPALDLRSAGQITTSEYMLVPAA